MKINEVEQIVGITKKNIRFYEDQGLITPSRNKENGYRNYTDEDILTLQKIKLLRTLAVPIEDIRKLEENYLSLTECMERHMILISHQKRNLDRIQEICQEISRQERSLVELSPAVYLQKIQKLEEGGTRFMNVQKEDIGRKKRGAVIAAVCMSALMLALAALLCWAYMEDPIPDSIFLFIMAMPISVIIGVLIAARQRLHELEGGEEYEASKY